MTLTKSQRTLEITRGYHFIPTAWTSYPTLNTLAVGSVVSVSGGAVVGNPVPTISYSITVNGVAKTWPYTLVSGDASATVVVTPVASGPSGKASAPPLSGVVPVPGAPPGPVTALSVINVSTTSMTPTWSLPVTGGVPTSYDVGYRVTGGGAYTIINTTSLSQAITGLTASTSYDIEVIAKNSGGSAAAVTTSQSTSSSGSAFYPSNELGMNVPPDDDYDLNRVYNDRSLAMVGPNADTRGAFYNYGYVTVNGSLSLPAASQDPTTGLPTTQFTVKLCEGNAQANDTALRGTWWLQYASTVKQTIGYSGGAAELTHTFSGGVGTVTFSYNGAAALILNFNQPVTSFGPVFTPENSATAIASGPGAVGRWNPAFLRTMSYDYLRMMDVCQTNSDYADNTLTTWKTSVAWSDRITASNYFVNTLQGKNGGMPLEWQIDLCNQKSAGGWFHIPANATDDFVTQHATMVASLLTTGKEAIYEFINECWNTGSAFYGFKKCGISALTEVQGGQPVYSVAQSGITSFASDGTTATIVLAGAPSIFGISQTTPYLFGLQSGYTGFQPTGPMTISGATITYPCTQASTGGAVASATVMASSGFIGLINNNFSPRQYGLSVASFSSNGTTATVVWTAAHGATTGQQPIGKLFNSGYTGFAPTGTLTVVDAKTITYPCTQAATTNPLAADVVLNRAGGGFLACNSASTLFTGGYITSVFALRIYWFHRRQFEVAALVKAAFVAAGRGADCKPVFALQYGTPYVFGTQDIQAYIRLVKSGAELNSVFKASTMGGYFALNLSFLDPGFGYTAGTGTPTDQASLLAQLRTFVDHCYGAYAYPEWIAWCKFAGLESYCYEAGVDTSTASGTATAFASGANSDPLMEGLCRDWIYNQVNLGFTKIGWYAGGASFQSGAGCFNLGRTVAEIDPSASSGGWGPKYKGIKDTRTAPTSQQPYHSFPCTFSSYDAVGNEAVVINGGVWPALDATGLPHSGNGFGGPLSAGTTYRVWSETTQAATFKMNGHTTGSAQVVTVTNLNTGAASTFTAPASSGSVGTGVDFPTCSVTLQPGMNYLLMTGATKAGAATVFPHSLQFS